MTNTKLWLLRHKKNPNIRVFPRLAVAQELFKMSSNLCDMAQNKPLQTG